MRHQLWLVAGSLFVLQLGSEVFAQSWPGNRVAPNRGGMRLGSVSLPGTGIRPGGLSLSGTGIRPGGFSPSGTGRGGAFLGGNSGIGSWNLGNTFGGVWRGVAPPTNPALRGGLGTNLYGGSSGRVPSPLFRNYGYGAVYPGRNVWYVFGGYLGGLPYAPAYPYLLPPDYDSYGLPPDDAWRSYSIQYSGSSIPDLYGPDSTTIPPSAAPPSPAFLIQEQVPVNIDIVVPADAEVWVNGVKTAQAGTRRYFKTPPLKGGTDYSYTFRARWTENGRLVEREQTVTFRVGDQVVVNLAASPAITAE